MRRKLLVLNLALVALAAAAGWRLREQWREGRSREQQVLRMKIPTPPAPAVSLERPPRQVTAGTYGDVAQQMLFAPDRNPNVIVEVAPPKPLPPLPVAHGVMNFGDGPVVILSEKPGGPHRGYSAGERVGGFKLLAVSAEEIVLEFDGQPLRKKLSDLKAAAEAPAPAAAAAPTAAALTSTAVGAAPAQSVLQTPSPNASGPGRVIHGQVRACQGGETSPAGTILNGMRKTIKKTPFGEICRWEPLQ